MSLFQKSVVNKYLTNLDNSIINKAYDQFKQFYGDAARIENIRLLKEENYQEGFLREIFVDVLGYTINPNINYNITTEYKNETDSKKADGAILLNGLAIGVIELKSTNTPNLESIREQAFSYKNHQPNCRFVITSNFEKLRLYIDNATDWEEFNLFYLDYENFKRFYLFLSYHSISVGITSKLKEESKLHEENISSKLYQDYSIFKSELYNDLIKLNPELDKLLLFHKSQKLLDRILFVLFAEDRLLIPPNTISEVIKQWITFKRYDEPKPLYSHFVKLFNHLDKGFKNDIYELHAYNGGLFKKDELLDNLIISDEVLHSNAIKLSKYGYNSEVDVNILGHIFENSITEIEQVKASLAGETPEKNRSRRKKEGIFYTPKYITKYIVDNTIGTLCTAKKKELGIIEIENDIIINNRTKSGNLRKEVTKIVKKLDLYREYLLSLKILDPACGSGAFLNQALDYLIEEHTLVEDYKKEIGFDVLGLYDITKSILENNLYGVDINEEAVEIAKLSLWIRTAEPGRKLSELNNNIKCGNSLIDDPAVAGDKAFNWYKEFPEIMSNGGFDVVIGNPPYVNVQMISKIDKVYFAKYFTTFYKRSDLFSLFIEYSIKVLTTEGIVSFIIPSQILNNLSYKKIRDLILSNRWLKEVCYVGNNVFNDATNDVVILILQKKVQQKIRLINALDFQKPIIENVGSNHFTNFNNQISIVPSNSPTTLLNKLTSNEKKIEDFYDVFQGIVTGDNNIFLFEQDSDWQQNGIEKELIKPVLHGRDISKWFVENNQRKILYIDNNNNIESYPGALNYLLQFKNQLETTKSSEEKSSAWYCLHRPREQYKFETVPKIIMQNTRNERLPIRLVATIDETGYYSTQGTNLIISLNKDYSIYFLLSLLNSKFINYIFKTYLLNLAIKAEYIKSLKIPNCIINDRDHLGDLAKVNTQNYTSLSLQVNTFLSRIQSNFTLDKLTNKLKEFYNQDFKRFLNELKKKKITLSLKQQDEWEQYFNEYKAKINKLQQQISQTDKEIDQLVYKLYGLTEEEIKIVEESVK